MASDHFAALEKYFMRQPTRQEGDLSDEDLAAHFKCSKETVRKKMKAAIDAGEWTQEWVVDKERGRIKIYRKTQPHLQPLPKSPKTGIFGEGSEKDGEFQTGDK